MVVMDKSELFNKLISSSTITTKNFNNDAIHNVTSWCYDLQGRAQKCVECCCALVNEATNKLHKEATPCLNDHQFKNDELQTFLDCEKFARKSA